MKTKDVQYFLFERKKNFNVHLKLYEKICSKNNTIVLQPVSRPVEQILVFSKSLKNSAKKLRKNLFPKCLKK